VRSDGAPTVTLTQESPLLLHFNGRVSKRRVRESPDAWPFHKLAALPVGQRRGLPRLCRRPGGFMSAEALGCNPGAIAGCFDGSRPVFD
jgi:hypothetical protein